jgi:hypothetical protein
VHRNISSRNNLRHFLRLCNQQVPESRGMACFDYIVSTTGGVPSKCSPKDAWLWGCSHDSYIPNYKVLISLLWIWQLQPNPTASSATLWARSQVPRMWRLIILRMELKCPGVAGSAKTEIFLASKRLQKLPLPYIGKHSHEDGKIKS